MSGVNGKNVPVKNSDGENVVETKRTRKPIAAGLSVIRATLSESTVNGLESKEESTGLDRNTLVEVSLLLLLDIASPEQRKQALKKVRELHVKTESDNI